VYSAKLCVRALIYARKTPGRNTLERGGRATEQKRQNDDLALDAAEGRDVRMSNNWRLEMFQAELKGEMSNE